MGAREGAHCGTRHHHWEKDGRFVPTSHNLEVPFVKRTEYQVLGAEAGDDHVSLLDGDNTKDDLTLPNVAKPGDPEPTDDDKKLAKEIIDLMAEGEKTVTVVVQAACGMEKIVQVKTS